ncbi:cytosolic sulfotransferase 14-like [Ananas comosus]|uniref:Sulfotransferase n=1 Tax=Ananas comosus TaxID=4615 RepID=A0A6P5EUE3_ANACO|nr:cytosolic sulfotransferase 14-like [Ananas comosus]
MAECYSFSTNLCSLTKEGEEDHRKIYQYFTDLVSTFSCEPGVSSLLLYRYNGWYASLPPMVGVMAAGRHFKAQPSNVLLATLPKSDTTWLKSLLFATVHSMLYPVDDNSCHPFTFHNPHECVPFLEYQVYVDNQIPNLDAIPSPRLFATHMPFQLLPKSMTDSSCRIVYLSRDPTDNFTSFFTSVWHFSNNLREKEKIEPWSLDEAVDYFCNGVSPFGLYWDHLLGYWTAQSEQPEKVLFLKYEEMRKDPSGNVKKLAEFVGNLFTPEKEEGGIIDGIIKLCGFESLRDLEVNKSGKTELVFGSVENSLFFRHRVAGGLVNYLTSEMARRIDQTTESKLKGHRLTFS